MRSQRATQQSFTVAAVVAALLLSGQSLVLADGPRPNTTASIAEGQQLFLRYCTECHGADAKAELDVIADATNLTEPEFYLNGTTVEDMFTSINEGAGVAMPAMRC